MPYPLAFKAPTGRTLKAVVKDLETSLFWDNIGSVWVAAETAACRISFTEGANKGFYTASGGLTATLGGIYEIKVIDTGDADYGVKTKEIFSPKSKTVLEVINAVETELRLPNSTVITGGMAKIILAKINTILQVILPGANIFDHLRVEGSFTIDNGRSLYRLCPVNVDTVDRIDFLKDADGNPITELDNDRFRAQADSFVASGLTDQPQFYRIAQRDYGFPILEFAPAPDAPYTVFYEAVKSPKELTAATDYIINPLVVKNGALAMVKQELGRDASVDSGIFQSALEKATSTESHAHAGDFEV